MHIPSLLATPYKERHTVPICCRPSPAVSPCKARRQAVINSPTLIKLRSAHKTAEARRLRVSFVMGQSGWALVIFGVTPIAMKLVGQTISVAVGAVGWMLALCCTPGALLLGLALFPTDGRAIRAVCSASLTLTLGPDP